MKTVHKNNGRITSRTKDDFLCWVKKKNALKEKRTADQSTQAEAEATWVDDGGQ
jgi:hypothetical protein